MTKQEALAASLGKTPVHWEDVLDNGLNLAANAVIEVWRDGAAMMSSITAGFRTIAAYRPCSPPPFFVGGCLRWCACCCWPAHLLHVSQTSGWAGSSSWLRCFLGTSPACSPPPLSRFLLWLAAYYLDKQMPNGYETYEWTNTWITFYTVRSNRLRLVCHL